MSLLDFDKLREFDEERFHAGEPYPWWNPAGLLRDGGWRRLCDTLPESGRFERMFGVKRAHGQQPHDRFALKYRRDLDIAPEWHELIGELQSLEYRRFLRRAFGSRRLLVSYHWHYTPRGASVSPHCDAKRKLGSHIFYMNRPGEWDPAWGGQTLILDDEGRFPRSSAPKFEDFARATETNAIGNHSLLFVRRGNSWHGVKTLACPENELRKVFIVVVESTGLAMAHRAYSFVRGKRSVAY